MLLQLFNNKTIANDLVNKNGVHMRHLFLLRNNFNWFKVQEIPYLGFRTGSLSITLAKFPSYYCSIIFFLDNLNLSDKSQKVRNLS